MKHDEIPNSNSIIKPSLTLFTAFFVTLFLTGSLGAEWMVETTNHPTQSSEVFEIKSDGILVAQYVFEGDSPSKPYLNLYGTDGEILTQDDPTAIFPHHRGVYLGWDEVESELGTHDVWHMDNGRMMAVEVEDFMIGESGVAFRVRIEWRATLGVSGGLLVSEQRTMFVSRPGGVTQVDTHCRLKAARELNLNGDLQHAGFHFRAHNEVNGRASETDFLESPEDSVSGDDLRWCRMMFGRGARRYAVSLFNAPENPVEELSQRDYGRFGYFFRQAIENGGELNLNYRIRLTEADLPQGGSGVLYEAEVATLGGDSVAEDSLGGFTGTGYVDFQAASGDFVEWEVNSNAGGDTPLSIRYALASGNRPLELRVNGVVVDPGLDFEATGDWTSWSTISLSLTLRAGSNTVRLTAIGSSGANIDHLAIDRNEPVDPDGGEQASRVSNDEAYADYLEWLTTRQDLDLDGMADAWETTYFGGLGRTGGDDFDGEGQRDIDEFIAGTNPTDAGSVFELQNILGSEGEFGLRWDSVAGRRYRILAATSLEGPWLPISDEIIGTGGELIFARPISETRMFFRSEARLQ